MAPNKVKVDTEVQEGRPGVRLSMDLSGTRQTEYFWTKALTSHTKLFSTISAYDLDKSFSRSCIKLFLLSSATSSNTLKWTQDASWVLVPFILLMTLKGVVKVMGQKLSFCPCHPGPWSNKLNVTLRGLQTTFDFQWHLANELGGSWSWSKVENFPLVLYHLDPWSTELNTALLILQYPYVRGPESSFWSVPT